MPESTWRARLKLLYRNSVAALVATGAEAVALVALVSGCHLAPEWGTYIACLLGGVVNFFINKQWTFHSQGRIWPMALRYALVSGGGAALAWGGMRLGTRCTSLPYGLIWGLIHLPISWGWHLPLQRFFVFGAPPPRPPT